MSDKIEKKQAKGLELVVMRNAFYRDSYHCLLFMVLLLLLINGFLGFFVFYKWSHPPQPQYFAATPDGRIIKIHPLSDPAVPDDFVLQWTTDAVRKAFSWDFMHWRAQLTEALDNFTPEGRRNFEDQLHSSNNLSTLITQQMVSNIEITGAPQIVRKAVVSGHFAWNIQIPALLTFKSANKTIPIPANLTVLVLREPVQDYQDKIAINNIFVATSGVAAAGDE